MKSSAPEKRVPFDPVASIAGTRTCTSASSMECIFPTPSQSLLRTSPEPPSFPSAAQASVCYPSSHTSVCHPAQMNLYQPPPLPQPAFVPSTPISSPPPLIPFQQASMNTQSGMWNIIVSQSGVQPLNTGGTDHKLFKLHIISGNISRCAGCKGKYSKPAPPLPTCAHNMRSGKL